jgi:hypothetical protein
MCHKSGTIFENLQVAELFLCQMCLEMECVSCLKLMCDLTPHLCVGIMMCFV